MAGFGRGPFGHGPFGWSAFGRTVKYELLPTEHRLRDEAEGYPLASYAEAVREPYDANRRRLHDLPYIRDPRRIRGPASESYPFLLGRQVVVFGAREQYGVDGAVLSLQEFHAATASFVAADRGKYITVSQSGVSGNNTRVRIASVVSGTTVLTDPPLAVDAGPLRWEVQAGSESGADEVVVEVVAGDAERVDPGYLLRDGEVEFTVLARRVFPNVTNPRRPLVPDEGSDGSVNASGLFVAPSLAASYADLGRPITLFDSIFEDNRGKFLLGPRVSAGVYRLLDIEGTPVTLVEDSGPFTWGLLPRPYLTLRGPAVPKGVQEQEGFDGVIAAPGTTVTLAVTAGEFVVGRDEGKAVLLIYPGVLYRARVTAVASSVSLTLESEVGAIPAGSALGWQLRTLTTRTLTPVVQVEPPSLLPNLAADFGLTVDRQESEFRQRAWVSLVDAWTKLKGVQDGYELVAGISGATVQVFPLFRVTQEIGEALPSDLLLDLEEWETGRYGVDGELSSTGAQIRLYSPTAVFRASDVGRQVRVSGSVTPSNNKLYTVDSVGTDGTEVVFRAIDTATVPETGLTWVVLRRYALVPPTAPRFDEINGDLMEEVIDGGGGDNWGIDRWCWEDDMTETVPVTVLSSTAVPPGRYSVLVSGRADVVVWAGRWKIVDVSGRTFFLETVPVSVDPMVPSFSFEIASTQAPTAGAASLTYVCPTNLSCDYCAASSVLLVVESILTDPTYAEMEQFADRVIQRFAEVVPIHVTLLARFTGVLEAGFGPDEEGLTAEIVV